MLYPKIILNKFDEAFAITVSGIFAEHCAP